MATNNSTWTPPPLSSVNWARNCSLSSTLLASGLPEYGSAKVAIIVSYMNSTLPESSTVYPNSTQLMLWYFSLFQHPVIHDPTINQTLLQPVSWYTKYYKTHDDPTSYNNHTLAIINDVLLNCHDEFCHTLYWPGYPDLAGEGMVDALIIESSLSTVYFLVLGGTSAGFFWQEKRNRIKQAFQETAVTYLDATLMFAASILASTLYYSVTLFMHYNEVSDRTIYQKSVLQLIVASSVLPSWTMQILIGFTLRRSRLRKGIWIMISAIWLVVNLVLFATSRSGPPINYWGVYVWEYTCTPTWNPGVSPFAISLASAISCLALTALVWRLKTVAAKELKSRLWRFSDMIQLFSETIAVALMWANLALFIKYRQTFVERTGSANQESAWTFGQVLTLATWAPVFIEFVYILKFGAEEGLSGKLSTRFGAIESFDAEEENNERARDRFSVTTEANSENIVLIDSENTTEDTRSRND